ncbi:MAG: class I SAM-dependent methyltransferase, partial [Candidatus ainarchaeum sp.]|nr:class I SAM-dependent methyltransferase [Candidatus ainarchaeum sp.]
KKIASDMKKIRADKAKLVEVKNRWAGTNAQLFLRLTASDLRAGLEKLGISPKETGQKPMLVVEGYTGKLALKLARAGYKLIFTDLHPDWVARAQRKGLRSIRADGENLPFITSEASCVISFDPMPLGKKFVEQAIQSRHGLLLIEEGRSSRFLLKAEVEELMKSENPIITLHSLKDKFGREYTITQVKKRQ